MQALVEGAIEGEFLEQIAFPLAEFIERRGARRAGAPFAQKLHEQELEEAQLEGGHAFVFDERGFAKPADFGIHRRGGAQPYGAGGAREIIQPFDIEVDEILIEDAIRQVGAGVEGAAIVNGVQRVEADEAGFQILRHPIDDAQQVAEIAASPIARAANAIEADRNSRRAPAVRRQVIVPGALGRHDVPRFGARLAHARLHAVVAERQRHRQVRHLANPGAPADFDRSGFGKVLERQIEGRVAAIFPMDGDMRHAVRAIGRNI